MFNNNKRAKVSFLPSILPKISPLLKKAKEKVKSNFLNNTNTIIGILVGIFTIAVYTIDLVEEFSNSEEQGQVSSKKDKEINVEITQPKKPETFNNSNSNSSNRETIKVEVPKKAVYFNNQEFLLENNNIALFIKNSKNQIHKEFQNNLSNALQLKNTFASTSFFTNESLSYFDNFYSANPNWLKKTKIQNQVKKYLIGIIKVNKSVSSEDSNISIINLNFQGKIVDISTNDSFSISKDIRETGYQEHRVINDAYDKLSKEITKDFYNI